MAISSTRAAGEHVAPASQADSIVVVPTYNEAENLTPLVHRILQHATFDVLVVDDNSPDGTGDIADSLCARFPQRVAVMHGSAKHGLGMAYMRGFQRALEAGYAFIFQMDADFSHNPDDLPAMRAALASADVVLGARYVPGGGTSNWPAWRRAISRGGSAYSGRVLNLPFHDLTSGYKGFRREVLEALDLYGTRSVGYAFQIEVTYRCARKGYRIVELPIVFQNRCAGSSKMSVRILLEALTMVWTLRLSHDAQEVQL
jgi:dolichol-phosphate mannosyltransferase